MNILTWLGHSGWQLKTSTGRILFIDPWLNGNPVAPFAIESLPQADYILVTHDHSDHAGDTVAVVQKTGATLIAQPETARRYMDAGVPEDKVLYGIGMNIGGTVDLDGIKVTMTDACHSSETGNPAGYVLTLEDGQIIYHMGDTGLHANQRTWAELFDVDVLLLPIGDVFTMGAEQAARALKIFQPTHALPMHYRTFPILAQSADDFVQAASSHAPDVAIHVIDPGESFTF